MPEYPEYKKRDHNCRHDFDCAMTQVIEQNKDAAEVIVALFCTKCGLFKTKILKFDRNLVRGRY